MVETRTPNLDFLGSNPARGHEQHREVQLTPGEVLTVRLRVFFGVITCCILPTVSTLVALLLYAIVIMSEQDRSQDCHGGVRVYLVFAVFVIFYTPNHRYFKKRILHYSRERDGANRPVSVLVADRIFQCMFVMYIFMGFGLMSASDGCDDKLWSSVNAVIIAQSVLVGLLLLPLFCVPCIFIYLLRSGVGVGVRNVPVPQGLSKSAAEAIPLIDYSAMLFNDTTYPADCPICFEPFSSSTPINLTTCNHVFHRECLGTWVQKNRQFF
ncbi:hypothetical protein TrRE_jg11136 [Triparma retinervis]|uniref:RING-type domain-containing protein n=1 Tax=Triparma retinervis TaxID=2557542 RepID=A0A9W6ZHM9_9STRA|nr:hypothetical protein TrRE_jg11136 [Triparma retinervis]